MNNLKKLTLSLFLVFSSSAFSNSTTSDIKGNLVDENGKALSGAEVTVTYEATNTTKTVITDENGNFYASDILTKCPSKYETEYEAAQKTS